MSYDKFAHAVVFVFVFALLLWTLSGRPLYAAILGVTFGGLVEIHQFFMSGFDPSLADWLADIVGILFGLYLHSLFRSVHGLS